MKVSIARDKKIPVMEYNNASVIIRYVLITVIGDVSRKLELMMNINRVMNASLLTLFLNNQRLNLL